MKLLTYYVKNEKKIGVLENDLVYCLAELAELYNAERNESVTIEWKMLSLIEKNETAIHNIWDWVQTNPKLAASSAIPVQEVRIAAPISNPGKVVCVGNNYMDHCIEQNVEPPKKPMIFSKWATCIIGDGEDIVLPPESEQVDYEAELAVVIGKGGKNISEEEAFDHVFGYTILNDVSARDIQFEDVQWVRGKSFDTFAPLGPVIVTKDEIEDPHNLDIRLEVNGEPLQDSNTKHLIFNIPHIISYLSKGFTFQPGDIIATGTPHGVGVFRNPQIFLQPGDSCKIEIQSIGVLENKVIK
jgi:2-keto-4-pentenoate hydratase/2-oxohepta-3-ene-1,7-dioic acid hydratase in catechol pathway